MTRVVKCIKPAQGLEVGKLYEVSCDNYELIHIVGGDGYSRDHFEYVQAVKVGNDWCDVHDENGYPHIVYYMYPDHSELPTSTPEPHVLTKYTRKSQIGGTHYSDLKIQPFEFIRRFGLDFFEGNVIKYLSRYKRKNGNEDLDKTIGYVREVWKDRKIRSPLFSCRNYIRNYCNVNGFPNLYEVLYDFMYGDMESCIAKIKELKK